MNAFRMASVALTAALSAPSHAAFNFDITEVGADVLVVGTGSIDTALLVFTLDDLRLGVGLEPNSGTVLVGPLFASNPRGSRWLVRTPGTQPTFGGGGLARPDEGVGDLVGI